MASSDVRLVRLLERGFYPVELPPVFRTHLYGDVRKALNPASNYVGSTSFFEGATYRGHLRKFGVINPVNYFLLSKFLADNWKEISDVYKLSVSSGARPKFPNASAAGRAIEVATLSKKRQSQRHLASMYPVILNLDINRFYGSIYTHTIPWSVLGKEKAKVLFKNKKLSGNWSDGLDRLVRNSNQQQTVGIPIGPDTSRIVSEILLSRLDAELCGKGTAINSRQIYHNIDDYQIGVFDVGDAEEAQSRFVRVINRYELRINDFKTSIQQGMSFIPENFQRYFDTLSGKSNRSFVEHFFELVYVISRDHPELNVVGYALKRFAKSLATNKERAVVREYLQRLLFAAPHHARWIMPLLLGIYRANANNDEISRIVSWGVEISTRRNDVGSLLWFLYAAIFMNVKLNKSLCVLGSGMSSPLVDLMLIDGRVRGLFQVSITDLRTRYLSSGFDSPDWLPLYEIERRGWDNNAAFTKIGTADDDGDYYKIMNDNNVEFYSNSADKYSVEAFNGWNLQQNDFVDAPEIPAHIAQLLADLGNINEVYE